MYKHYLLFFFILPLAALNAACAQTGSSREVQAADVSLAQNGENESLEERVRRVLGKTPAPVDSGLDADLLYKFLVAEIAGQRGDVDLAAENYLELTRASRDARVAQRATEVALYAKRNDIALEAAALWQEAAPDSSQARRTRAELLLKTGNFSSARPLLTQMLATEPEGAGQTLMQLYDMCAGNADTKGVFALLRELTPPYVGLPESHYVMARAAYDTGDRKRALKSTEQALKLRPDWQQAALFKSHLLGAESNAAALTYVGDFVQRYPEAHDVRLNYARALIAERNYDLARTQFRKLVEANPKNANLAFTLGLLSAQMEDYSGADTQFRNALSLGHSNPDAAYYQLGQVNEQLGHAEEAARWYREVQGGDQYVAAQSRYALILARKDGVDEARQYLQSLEAADDEQRVQLIQAEAHMLRQVRKYQQSFDVLESALDARPEHPALLYDIALAAEKIDRLDVVESRLLKLIELDPNSPQAYNALGYTLADRTDRYAEARRYIAKALDLAPDDPFILDSMGWVEFRLGNLKEGIRLLRRAYQMQPDPEIAAHLGEALWVDGVEEEARRIWTDTAGRHPDNEILQAVMRKFLKR